MQSEQSGLCFVRNNFVQFFARKLSSFLGVLARKFTSRKNVVWGEELTKYWFERQPEVL